MLFRVTGKLTDGRPLSSRFEDQSALGALGQFSKKLIEAKVAGSTVAEIAVRPMGGSADVYIGEARKPKAKAK